VSSPVARRRQPRAPGTRSAISAAASGRGPGLPMVPRALATHPAADRASAWVPRARPTAEGGRGRPDPSPHWRAETTLLRFGRTHTFGRARRTRTGRGMPASSTASTARRALRAASARA